MVFPVRVPVFVMQLAELKAKPDANHANAYPINDWSCQICNQHRATSTLADLVSNPTPPGKSRATGRHRLRHGADAPDLVCAGTYVHNSFRLCIIGALKVFFVLCQLGQ